MPFNEIIWKNIVRDRRATDDNIIRRMRFVRWVTKATDTHSEYVILIAFAWQQWLRERASLLHVVPLFLVPYFIDGHQFVA